MTAAKPDRVVVGIDPGGKESGVVVRWGAQLLDHRVVTASGLAGALGDLREFVTASQARHGFVSFLVAVEDVHAPNPHMGVTNVDGILATAQMLGAVRAVWPDAIVVPPGGNGSAPRAAYPVELWGPKEGAAGTGKLRHCRSGWDVSIVGEHMWKQRQREAS